MSAYTLGPVWEVLWRQLITHVLSTDFRPTRPRASAIITEHVECCADREHVSNPAGKTDTETVQLWKRGSVNMFHCLGRLRLIRFALKYS